MSDDALTKITLRNTFYRDGQHKLIAVFLVSVIANIMLAALLIYIITHPPTPKYFATSSSGRITPLFALNEPNTSDNAVVQWSSVATMAAYSYNFVNYRTELEAASGFFTGAGWDQFMAALRDSNNLDAVKSKKLVVSAVVTGAPVILKKGLLSDRYAWRIQMPLLVTYQSASEFTQQNLNVTLLVTRIDTLNSPTGIGIAQFISAPANTGSQ